MSDQLDPHDLRAAVERALSESREAGVGLVWGPRHQEGFRFGTLSPSTPREGGPLAWVLRVLISWYYIEHDNQPATAEDVYTWVEGLAPDQIERAVGVAIVVGLP